jgi:small subunit ribosomal protein S15
MARTHVHTHGKSHSIRPTSKSIPSWVKSSPDQVSSLVLKMSKEGFGPSEIGMKLRDEHGVPLAKPIVGKKLTQILADNDIKMEIPEDLDRLVRKAAGLQKHLKAHNSDHRNVRSLELVEAKIHRLAQYYKNADKIPESWKYAAVIAQLE